VRGDSLRPDPGLDGDGVAIVEAVLRGDCYANVAALTIEANPAVLAGESGKIFLCGASSWFDLADRVQLLAIETPPGRWLVLLDGVYPIGRGHTGAGESDKADQK
jgi:hypothetical protein